MTIMIARSKVSALPINSQERLNRFHLLRFKCIGSPGTLEQPYT